MATQTRSVFRRAVNGLEHLLAEMLDNEVIAQRPGLLQSVDARSKVLGLAALLVTVTLTVRLPGLALAYLACLALAALSGVPWRRLSRTWLAVPAFSLAAVAPAILTVVTPGHVVVALGHGVAISGAGLFVALRFVLRSTTCVTLALLLTATTRPDRLFRGLRALGTPKLFVMLLSMMERYLTVFVRAAEEIHLAKLSRTMEAGNLRQEQAWVAAGMGALFRRTQQTGGEVYLAMVSRGYTGEVHLLDEPRWRATDWAFLLLACGLCTMILAVG